MGGVACVAVQQLRRATMARLALERARLPMAPDLLVAALLRAIVSWTVEIPSSRADTTPLEADPGRAEDKRAIDWDRFTDTALADLVRAQATLPAALDAPPPLPGSKPPALPRFHVIIDGQDSGPLDQATLRIHAQEGVLSAESLVWTPGMADWTAAGEIPAMARLLGAQSPPLPSRAVEGPPPLPRVGSVAGRP